MGFADDYQAGMAPALLAVHGTAITLIRADETEVAVTGMVTSRSRRTEPADDGLLRLTELIVTLEAAAAADLQVGERLVVDGDTYAINEVIDESMELATVRAVRSHAVTKGGRGFRVPRR